MKSLLLIVALALPSWGTTYYLAPAPTGSDSNNGTSAGTPWLSPAHAVNCGDVLIAATGAYDPANFYYSWHSVTCASSNNVAWVKCTTFAACTMAVTASGVAINQPYWGMQGFAITGVNGVRPVYSGVPKRGQYPSHRRRQQCPRRMWRRRRGCVRQRGQQQRLPHICG